ncbi:hypothetical protein T4B_6433 [Trichinella pseudospiralis]|uniref:Uncharacterized protein n=1 Tax=Trichinella pseudospiralis TaxID=6337 RepID=A0A0V1GKR4_TRIPS|nr:hypothetical protein T4B_6433 [Trichinella pseudospiralis]
MEDSVTFYNKYTFGKTLLSHLINALIIQTAA